MHISGKVFIVTGGASGLGEGTARRLAAQGGMLVIADMQAEKGQAVARDIGGAFVPCDVSSQTNGQPLVPHALAVFSRAVTVNLIGSFNMLRLAAQAMCQNEPEPTGERGVLISTASVA